jgi:carnosine synthase
MPSHAGLLAWLVACLQDKLFARSAEGQRMRLSVLRGSVIAFVTAGYSGKRFIFEKCR